MNFFFFLRKNLPVTDGKGRAVVNELPRWWLRNPACAEALLCHEGNRKIPARRRYTFKQRAEIIKFLTSDQRMVWRERERNQELRSNMKGRGSARFQKIPVETGSRRLCLDSSGHDRDRELPILGR